MRKLITEIQSNAFEFCTELNIDLSNVEVIGSSAFVGCSFTSVDLSSATSIGANAFAYSNVAEITLPIDGLTLGGNVFRNCEITTIHYAGTQQQFEDLLNGTGNANLIWDLVTNS